MAVGGQRRAAAKRNETVAPYTGRPNVPAATFSGVGEDAGALRARLRLLEGFVGRAELLDCAQLALHWLDEALGIASAVCLIRQPGEHALAVAASYGVHTAAVSGFTISLDDWANPLVPALTDRTALFFAAPRSASDRRRRPVTPLEDDAVLCPAAWRVGCFGGGVRLAADRAAAPPGADLQWFTTVFSQKLDQLVRQQAQSDGDRRHGRERSLLYSIINAVSDPILLTDPEGRLLIANARALTLFTAAEEESEGRRGAVRMNNMLLSSALSSKAIEETGAARRELLLVNPIDGSDLVFELLSTIAEDSRHGSGVVSILRNVTDLRRASEEIEDNYRKMRVAEVLARAESDRLNLIIDSVADPIVVTDAGGATSLDERAGRAPVHPPARRQRRRAALGAGERRPFLVVHRRHAGQCRPAAGRARSA